jgi:glycerol-3-phosphate cytidylyltransferase-like family protein
MTKCGSSDEAKSAVRQETNDLWSELLACKFVDGVVPNHGGADSKPAIELVDPDYIVIGSDWATKDYYKQMGFTQDWLDSYGIALVYIPYTKGVSSSEIKTRL